MSSQDYTPESVCIVELLDLNAWLVPLRGQYGVALPEDKAAYDLWKEPTRSWKDKAACEREVRGRLAGNFWVGLIPSSLGLVVLDVDEGNADELDATLKASDYEFRRARTRRGWHFYLRAAASWPTGNWDWSLAGCAGQIRYDKGYVVVWDPGALLETIELGDLGAADESLASSMGKNRKAGQRELLRESDIVPARYPPGARDEKLLSDLNALAHQGLIDHEPTIDRYRQAWMAAADPKAGEDRLSDFEDKRARAREYVAGERAEKAAAGVFDVKSAEVLRQCLALLDIAWAFNKRSGRYEYKRNGGWMRAEKADALEASIIEEIATCFKYERPQGGTIPLRFSMGQFEQFMTAFVGLYPMRAVDDFVLWLERELPEWDGEARIETFLIALFGCEDNRLTRWASRYLCLAAIQRAYQPACKLDEFPVLIGKQGWGKSALLANLFPADRRGAWYTASLDMTAPVKERIEATMGAVLVEVAEMAGVGRDLQRQKAWFTTTTDKARLAYDRATSDIPRRFALAGTADRRESLPNDPAGNRRFVAIELARGAPVESRLEGDRLQLWAEALMMYRASVAAGELRVANLPRDLMAAQAEVNEEFRLRDDQLEDRVAQLGDGALSYDAIVERVGLGPNISPRQKARLTAALELSGWHRRRLAREGKRVWLWVKKRGCTPSLARSPSRKNI